MIMPTSDKPRDLVPVSDADERYMRVAIDAAHIAEENGDVPIGAVIVCKKNIIA